MLLLRHTSPQALAQLTLCKKNYKIICTFTFLYFSLEDVTTAMKKQERSVEIKDEKIRKLEKEYVYITSLNY